MKSSKSSGFSVVQVAFLIACALSLQRLLFGPGLLLTDTTTIEDETAWNSARTTRYIPENQVLSVRIQADEQQTSNNNDTTTITIGDSRYPYIPWNILSECLQYVGPLDTGNRFPNSMLSLIKPQPLNQSLGYIKTFKTGSSTIANLVNRVVDSRNLPKLIPTDHTYLGFPEAFPGKYEKIAGTSRYRAISNHAVFHRWLLEQYLRDPILTFTILREPLSRTISGYKFFEYWNDRSWRQFLDYVKSIKRVRNFYQATATNSMAYSLGWYHQFNGSRKYDQNETRIREFIAQLDNQMDLVMIVEKMDQSLLLLRDKLPGLALSELVHYRFKDNSKLESNYTAPTSSELQELSDLLLVDRMIYEHFNKRLDEQWESLKQRTPEIDNVRKSFVCLQERVQSELQNNSTNSSILPKKLRTILTLDSGAYTKILQRKQRDRSRKPSNSSIISPPQTAPSSPSSPRNKYAVVHYLDDGNLDYLYGLYSIHHQMIKLGMTPDVVSHVVVVPNHYNSTNLAIVEKLLGGPDNIRRVDPNQIQKHIPKRQNLWEGVFNKMFLFNLTEFDKVIALDLDVLVRKNILHWFDYDTPCGSMEKNTFEWNSGAMVLQPNSTLLDEMITAMHSMKRFWGWGNMFKYNNKFAIEEDPGNTGHGQQGFLTSFFTDPSRPNKRRCFLPREAACQSSLLMNHLSTSMEYFLRYRRDTLETIHFSSSKPWEKKHSYTNSPFLCDMFREWIASLECIEEYLEPFDEQDMFDECIYSNITTESGV